MALTLSDTGFFELQKHGDEGGGGGLGAGWLPAAVELIKLFRTMNQPRPLEL